MNFFDGYKEGIFVDLLFATIWESLFVKKLMIKTEIWKWSQKIDLSIRFI